VKFMITELLMKCSPMLSPIRRWKDEFVKMCVEVWTRLFEWRVKYFVEPDNALSPYAIKSVWFWVKDALSIKFSCLSFLRQSHFHVFMERKNSCTTHHLPNTEYICWLKLSCNISCTLITTLQNWVWALICPYNTVF